MGKQCDPTLTQNFFRQEGINTRQEDCVCVSCCAGLLTLISRTAAFKMRLGNMQVIFVEYSFIIEKPPNASFILSFKSSATLD